MALLQETKGLVLHAMPIGDYDKRLIILTKEYGKVQAFAKGAKRPSSKLLAGSEIFSYGEYTLYKGKNSMNVTAVSMIESFSTLRQDIEGLSYGLYLLEVADYVCEENNPNQEVMQLILKTLKVIEKNKIAYELIIKIFQLRTLCYLGFSPMLTNCVYCGKEEELNHFNVNDGGVICKHCTLKYNSDYTVSEATRYAMQYISTVPLKELYKFTLNHDTMIELSSIVDGFFQHHIPKKFNALAFLEALSLTPLDT